VTGTGSRRIALAPDRCDGCGRCVPVCPTGALHAGSATLFVDVSRCDGCLLCLDACPRDAILYRAGTRTSVSESPGRPLVASRAEAKSVKERELNGQRFRAKLDQKREKSSRARARATALSARDDEAGRAVWTMTDAGVVLIVMMASLIAGHAVRSSEVVTMLPEASRAVVRALTLAGFYAAQILTLGFLAARHGHRLSTAFGLTRSAGSLRYSLVTSITVVGLLFLTRASATLWGMFARSVGWQPPPSGTLTTIFGSGGTGFLLAAITVVVVGPIAEELAFRGVVLRAAAVRWGQWPAILGSTLLFSAYHVTAWTAVPLVILGVALGWLALSRESLRACICLHSLYNLVVVGAAYLVVA
jgi:membrane protease YdiL (CAAX protease family)/ferredoxin